MKRLIFIFVIVILLSFSACSNQSDKFSIEMLPDNIEEVSVSHYLSGKETGWTIESDGLEEWKLWLKELSARREDFEEGNTPGDGDGGEVYSFSINNGESNVSYVINGSDDCYLLFESEWYAVPNPKDPF